MDVLVGVVGTAVGVGVGVAGEEMEAGFGIAVEEAGDARHVLHGLDPFQRLAAAWESGRSSLDASVDASVGASTPGAAELGVDRFPKPLALVVYHEDAHEMGVPQVVALGRRVLEIRIVDHPSHEGLLFAEYVETTKCQV